MIRPCVIIPVYEHGETVEPLVGEIAPLGLPCLIVDDGSAGPTRERLDSLAARAQRVEVLHLPVNRGKGVAMTRGLQRALEAGYSHAVQIDADGQHAAADIPRFLQAAEETPDALLIGAPIFGPEAPRVRLIGRKLSVFWVAVETLSRAITDPLCGYRCYPVGATVALLERDRIGRRMDFDPEIAVRLYWEGLDVRNIPTRVRYFAEGLSHFRAVRDSAWISWMHTRLVFGMLRRMPQLLSRT